MANENNASATTSTAGEALRARRAERLRRYEAAKVQVHLSNGETKYLDEFNATLKREASEPVKVDKLTTVYLSSLFAATAAKRIIDAAEKTEAVFGFVCLHDNFYNSFKDAVKNIDKTIMLFEIPEIGKTVSVCDLVDIRNKLFRVQTTLLDILNDTGQGTYVRVGNWFVPAATVVPIIGGKDCSLENNGCIIEIEFNPYEVIPPDELKYKICSFYEAIKHEVTAYLV